MQRLAYKRLLIISLVLNGLGLLGGGFYVYQTKSAIVYWYDKYIHGVSDVEQRTSAATVYYSERLGVFDLMRSNTTGRKAIIFAGDSLIEAFEWAEYFQGLGDAIILNRGIGGDTIDRLLDRFDATFPAEYTLQRIFIMVGINDLGVENFRAENFISKYRTFLRKLSSHVPPDRICVQSILPVRRDNISNNTIKEINGFLRSHVQAEGFCYIDLYRELVDSTERLDAKYSLDGIHLTSAGYGVWLETIKPYVLN